MAQTTNYEIANSSGLVFRGRVNEVFAAVQSNNSGATEPTGTVAYQLWYDTTTNILKMRNAANSAWISLFTVDQTNGVWSVNANSTSDALRITQTGTGNALLVEDSANPDSTPFVITAAGDVGIGTTTPTNTLTVNGTIGGTIVATQAEAEAGTDTTKLMTPLRVKQAITSQVPPVESLTLLGNFSTTSGSTATLSGLTLTPYKILRIRLRGVSRGGTTSTFNLSTGGVVINLNFPDTASLRDTYDIWLDTGHFVYDVASALTTNATTYRTSSTSVSLSLSANTFDAGSVDVYGIK